MKSVHSLKPISALALATLLGAATASAEKFTVAVIPDTQNYCDTANPTANPQPGSVEIYQREMLYLASQKIAQNIVFATHVGDVVQHGDLYDAEWRNAKSAMNILAAAGIPFGMSPGNHDYDNYSHPAPGNRPIAGSVKWNQYFGPSSHYFANKHWYGGSYNGGLDSFQTFKAAGKTFLHISLEMEASDDAIAWANAVIASHPGLPTIVTTHEYLSYQNAPYGKALYLNDGYLGARGNSVQGVWDKFISRNDQIFLVLCGHNWSPTVNGVSNGENLRTDNNAFGHPVYQVLSDYQGNTFSTAFELLGLNAFGFPGLHTSQLFGQLTGGAGWLRLMTFDTEAGTIHFQTYSSELNQYAGVPGGPTFNLDPSMSDFTLPIPERVLGQPQQWSFGVLSDTQWTVADDGMNPNTSAANIIKQVNQQFINHGVKLVVAVGDMTDTGSQTNDYVRALYAQDLYNAGIGFYPTRGNHEAAEGTYTGSGADFRYAYPQIVPGPYPGWNNTTPWDITTSLVSPIGDLANNPPASPLGTAFAVGVDFTSPTGANLINDSVSYAFNFNNVTFMLLDQFHSPDYYSSHIPEQMDWINATLSSRPANTHAFAFTHKNILGGNHKDNMFGGPVSTNDPGDCFGVDYNSLAATNQVAMVAKTNAENTFLAAMYTNDVRYVVSGHDHHHYHSLVISPDRQSLVHQLICASDSSKFYKPVAPVSANDLPVEQELYRIGYYIFTVEGPRVTIDYYAHTTTNDYKGPFNFVKRSTTGYSLNGEEFLVAEGSSYVGIADTTAKAAANGEKGYLGTTMSILAGMNSSTATNNYGKAQAKDINTGWAPAPRGLASDILTLWGMADLGAQQTSTYVLQMSYNKGGQAGNLALATRDEYGFWVNAVNMNTGGTAHYVSGPWQSDYPLGTYGFDAKTKTAWAVLNYNGEFAVCKGLATPAEMTDQPGSVQAVQAD